MQSEDNAKKAGGFPFSHSERSAFHPRLLISPKEPATSYEKCLQKRLVYYSDFDISVEDWTMEYDSLKLYSQTLQKALGDSWRRELNITLFQMVESTQDVPQRTAWEVILEYVLLTNRNQKEVSMRIAELEQYLNFYGFEVGDEEIFQKLIVMLFNHIPAADSAVQTFWNLDTKFKMLTKQQKYDSMKNIYSKADCETPKKKQAAEGSIKYILLSHVITPLMVANEKVTELYIRDEPMETETPVEARLEAMEISERVPEVRQSKSMHLQRSVIEMQKLDKVSHDIFSSTVLQTIISYIDYNSKSDLFSGNVIGSFPVIILELNSSELKNIHAYIGSTMSIENINMRIIKPYKKFYTTLIQICFKYGINGLCTLPPAEFIAAASYHLAEAWKPTLKVPTERFYEWIVTIIFKGNMIQPSDIFEALKCKMITQWELYYIIINRE